MKKHIIVLFIVLFLSICYSRQMQIPISSENSPTTIEIYNLKGQKILTKEFTRYNSAPISLSNNLANQIYVMRIKNGDKIFTRKFMPDTKIRFVGNFTNTNKISTNKTLHIPEIQYQNLLRTEPLGDSVTNIIFINGMLNTKIMADVNLVHIRMAYKDTLNTEEYPGKYMFTLGYNQTHGRIHDFSEVMLQWQTEFSNQANVNALEWLAPIIDEEYYEEAMEFFADAKAVPKSNERKNFITRIAEIIFKIKTNSVTISHSETTNDLRKITDESFEKKYRVIIISHSQGNLFANELIDYYKQYDKEEEIKRIEVLNIAPPAVSTSKSWYYTNKDDAVINDARKKFNSKILPGLENGVISGKKDPRERRRHKFWESYFHDDLISRQLIDNVFLKYCKELPFWFPYHPDDVAQINKLIEEHGLNWEYDNPDSWNENFISWTDDETNRRVTRLRAAGVLGDVSLDLPMLDSLNLSNGQIISLDVSKCVKLTYLSVSYNQLTSLDLSKNTALVHLFVRENQLTFLDLLKNKALEELNAQKNLLTFLDVSNNTALMHLWLANNRLTFLDVSNNTALKILGVDNNFLTSLDVSNNPMLTNLSCNGNLKDNICP
ncbi:MAG: T9SS type A sorting domain-containing protein [Chitinivibrionia bacterium]|nr:T9SS type A sorting domain-containing protein [Chitinivibrionia bacterium]